MPKKANIFESFSHSAIQQFKEAFGIMDADKDGLLSASDLVAAFGAHGKSIGSGDAQVNKSLFLKLYFKKVSLYSFNNCYEDHSDHYFFLSGHA